MTVTPSAAAASKRVPWNKGKIVGAKPPLRHKHVWSIRTKLQVEGRTRDLAMFLLGHTKIESTVRYPGIEVDDALAIAEQVDVCLQGQSRLALRCPPRRLRGHKQTPRYVGSGALIANLSGAASHRGGLITNGSGLYSASFADRAAPSGIAE